MQSETPDADDDEVRYFMPGSTRNAQKSTVDIREDAERESADPALLESKNPWLAAVVRQLYTGSTATVVNVFDDSLGAAHIGVYDRSEDDLSASLLAFLQDIGFKVIHAKQRSLPYTVDGETVYEKHAYGEFRLWDEPTAAVAIDRAKRDRHRGFREDAGLHPMEVGDCTITLAVPQVDDDE